jgi:hypothetical protein
MVSVFTTVIVVLYLLVRRRPFLRDAAH